MNCQCTWRGCENRAVFNERDVSSFVYARLCRKHHTELKRTVESGDHKAIFKIYTRACGFDDASAKPGIACHDPTIIPPEGIRPPGEPPV